VRVICTCVADVPELMVAGLKAQLDELRVVSAGAKEHVNVAGVEANEVPAAGVTVKVYGKLVCPASTVCEELPAFTEKLNSAEGEAAAQAIARLLRSTDPSPATRL